MSIMNTVQMIHKTCVESNCKRVFMAGSYANHPYMKEKFTYEWLNRVQEAAMLTGSNVSTKSVTFLHSECKNICFAVLPRLILLY